MGHIFLNFSHLFTLPHCPLKGGKTRNVKHHDHPELKKRRVEEDEASKCAEEVEATLTDALQNVPVHAVAGPTSLQLMKHWDHDGVIPADAAVWLIENYFLAKRIKSVVLHSTIQVRAGNSFSRRWVRGKYVQGKYMFLLGVSGASAVTEFVLSEPQNLDWRIDNAKPDPNSREVKRADLDALPDDD